MWAYIARRLLLTIPTVLGVLLLTFVLFSLISQNPERAFAGKSPSPETLKAIKHKMGLDKPRFFNLAATTQPLPASEKLSGLFNTQFFDLALFRFPESMRQQRSVMTLIKEKAPVSLMIQLPALAISLGLQLGFALLIAARRNSMLDYAITGLSVASLAVPSLVAYILFQWCFGAQIPAFPVAGWEKFPYSIQYAALPILASVFLTVGGGIRFYRTVILEEINADYVRTARAKGLASRDILLTHVLRNVLIPTITQTVAALPFLIFGALILERLFQIPGLGGLLVDSIFSEDRSVVMAITYITALMYCAALLLSDILYTFADPRVSLS